MMVENRHSPDTLFSTGQIRLAEISVFNWGSFHGLHSVKINPDGTLITGENGSGKTTIIDGLMALLLPAGKANFNVAAAQGDTTDRSLVSYIRGSYATDRDGSSTRTKSKREGSVCTAVRALYLADDGSVLTLAALFFLSNKANAVSEVDRLYLAAKRNVQLKELLDILGQGEKRKLKKYLNDDPLVKTFDNKFSTYQEYYLKLLQIENKKAPNLLSRALGLKKIDNLTKLIRELVLEPSSIREDAKAIVEEFANLVAIHHELQDASAQKDFLEPLLRIHTNYQDADKQVKKLNQLLEGLPAYFGETGATLWQQRLSHLNEQNQTLNNTLEQQKTRKQLLEDKRDRAHADYIQQGGKDIEELKKELKRLEKDYDNTNKRASHYQEITRALGFDTSIKQQQFHNNQQNANQMLGDIGQELEASKEKEGELRGHVFRLNAEEKQLKADIEEIKKKPDSAIDPRYHRVREEMLDSLGIQADELVFIGELINVKPAELAWQGAIERAMGGNSTTLLVPAKLQSQVSGWVNARHLGLRLQIETVHRHDYKQTDFRPEGYLAKLDWKAHPYQAWLQNFLAPYDLSCVTSVDELNATEFSMTQEGLIHKRRGSLVKDDRSNINDQRFWNIGFSNKSRLIKLNEEHQRLLAELSECLKQVKAIAGQSETINNKKNNLEKLLAIQWADIDIQSLHDEIELYRQEIQALESASGILNELKNLWETAIEEVEAIETDIRHTSGKIAVKDNEISNAEKQLAQAQEDAGAGLDDTARKGLLQVVGKLSLEQLDAIDSIKDQHKTKLHQQRDRAKDAIKTAETSASRIMGGFRGHEKWRTIAEDWGSDIFSIEQYIQHHDYLANDGLPTLKDKFIAKLSEDGTQSLASIRQKLNNEHEDIRDRIDTINGVLYRTAFREGTYLRLVSAREEYAHVRDFYKKVTHILSRAKDNDPFEQFKRLNDIIQIIEKASILSPHTLESMQLLEPRYQLRFIAEEIRREDGEIVDTLTSSSGKSGGEKESFAGIIVAASLAYVLTPDGYDKPIYSTVFLDEALSNTSESVSRRVLKVFKELHIHINLITPYKNLNIARESANSLLIAERNAETHESRFIQMSWLQIDEHLAQREKTKTRQQAQAQGITLEEIL